MKIMALFMKMMMLIWWVGVATIWSHQELGGATVHLVEPLPRCDPPLSKLSSRSSLSSSRVLSSWSSSWWWSGSWRRRAFPNPQLSACLGSRDSLLTSASWRLANLRWDLASYQSHFITYSLSQRKTNTKAVLLVFSFLLTVYSLLLHRPVRPSSSARLPARWAILLDRLQSIWEQKFESLNQYFFNFCGWIIICKEFHPTYLAIKISVWFSFGSWIPICGRILGLRVLGYTGEGDKASWIKTELVSWVFPLSWAS